MSPEHILQNAIRNALASEPLMLFRANVGSGWQGKVEQIARAGQVWVTPGDVVIRGARPFSTGLPNGFADLFGVRARVITADDVGQTLGQFVALEVKTPRGRVSPAQRGFVAAVTTMGGAAGIVRSVDEAREVIR